MRKWLKDAQASNDRTIKQLLVVRMKLFELGYTTIHIQRFIKNRLKQLKEMQ